MSVANIKSLVLLRNINWRILRRRTLSSSLIKLSKKEELEDLDQPIQYLKSDAARWKARVTRTGGVDDAPWFQPYIISGSLAIFMAYFFFLREESDIDLEFEKTLGDRITGIDERQLEIVLEYNRQNGLPTRDIEDKLEELRGRKSVG